MPVERPKSIRLPNYPQTLESHCTSHCWAGQLSCKPTTVTALPVDRYAIGSSTVLTIHCILWILLQILATVLEHGEPTEVLHLIVTAAQCMKEVAVDKKVVELRHPGKGDSKLTKTVSYIERTK